MTTEAVQLPLKLNLGSQHGFDNYLAGSNGAPLKALTELACRDVMLPAEPVFLWGEGHTGKSHLLAATCQARQTHGGQAVVMPVEFLRERQYLELIAGFDLVCLDDIHQLAGDAEGEQRLFDWINHLRQRKTAFVLASRLAPGDGDWQLPDLVSRLNWGRAWRLHPLNRHQALEVFTRRAHERGLSLDNAVLNWLQRNKRGDLKFLLQLLDKIDEKSLQTRRKITIPWLKELIDGLV